jgi:hypothetical protein
MPVRTSWRISFTAAGRASNRCFLAHAARAELRDEPVAPDGNPFVEEIVANLDHAAAGHHDRPLEHGAQLADVAGPEIRVEPPHRFRRYLGHVLPELPRQPRDEVGDDGRNVLAPIHERRHDDPVARKGREQRVVRALPVARHVLGRRRDHPDRGRRTVRRSLLEQFAKRRPALGRQVVHGIEEQRPAGGQLELAGQQFHS